MITEETLIDETMVRWHKFPQEKPTINGGTYLVTVFDKQENKTFVITDVYHCLKNLGGVWFSYNNGGYKVIAWAELPNPYKAHKFS